MNSFEIEIPGYYVIKKKGKEQVVKFDNKINDRLFKGYYGIYGYHEVTCEKSNIRELTEQEKEDLSKKHLWKLPQQFYHSFLDNEL